MFVTKSLPDFGPGLPRETVQAMLPKVGDIRMEIPTIQEMVSSAEQYECVVIEVHPDHLWYRVRFTDTGIVECYKVPQTGRLAWEE